MKQLIVLVMSISMLMALPSCKKGDEGPAGPSGPQGPAGPQGPIGITGNANVTQYNFPGHDFAADASSFLQVTTTADTMARSAWHVYLVRSPNSLVYPMPGFGYNAVSDYRMYWSFTSKANFFINKVSGAGEDYSSIRIIRFYANNVMTGGKFLEPQPEIDFSDYYAVCKYYNLPTD
jgi:hypothetical protein